MKKLRFGKSNAKLGKIRFMIYTIDRDAVRTAATKRGWEEASGFAPSEFVEPDNYTRGTKVESLEIGVAKCLEFINSGKSWWGSEYVQREEWRQIEPGYPAFEWKWTDHWTVSDEGIEEHVTNDE